MKVFLTVFTLMSCLAFAKFDTFSEEQMQIKEVGSCGCTDCKCTRQNHCGCMAKPAPKCGCKGPSCPCNRHDPSNDYDDENDDTDDKDDGEDKQNKFRSRW